MTAYQSDVEKLRVLCLGNQEAMAFVLLWLDYVHLLDDLVDDDVTAKEEMLRSYIVALEIYTHPFFVRNAAGLKQLVVNVTNLYADSVAWEKSPSRWRSDFADVARHAGNEVILAIAYICGGYAHLRRISPELRYVAGADDRNRKGAK